MSDTDTQWYYCLKHQRTERGQTCPAEDRMGPYASEEAARDWRRRSQERNRTWDEDDAAWRQGG